MEDTALNSQRPSLSEYFPPLADVAKRSLVYGASCILSGRLNPTSLTVSAFNVITVSFAQKKFANEETNGQQQLIIAIASLAASTLIVTIVGVPLLGRVSDTMNVGSLFTIGCFNALGEAASFVISWKFSGPKLPETTEELEDFSKEQLLHIRHNFDSYKTMTAEVFAAFVIKLQQLEDASLLPKPPESVKEVETLDSFTVFYIFHHYDTMTDGFERVEDVKESDLYQALHLRFYQEDLPFPKGETIQSIKEAKEDFPEIQLELPKTAQDFEKLSKSRLAWLYVSLHGSGDFGKLPMNVQVALNTLFMEHFNWSFWLEPTVENLQDVTQLTWEGLYKEYQEYRDVFAACKPEVKKALNEGFVAHVAEAKALATELEIPEEIAEIDDEDISNWSTYFLNNPEQWEKLGGPQKEAFKKLFTENDYEVSHLT